MTVKDSCLSTTEVPSLARGLLKSARTEDDLLDNRAPKSHLTNNLIQRPFADKKFLGDIAEAIKGRPSEREQITLELITAGNIPAICSGDMVACNK